MKRSKKKKINSKSVERMKNEKDTDIWRKEFKKLRKQNG